MIKKGDYYVLKNSFKQYYFSSFSLYFLNFVFLLFLLITSPFIFFPFLTI